MGPKERYLGAERILEDGLLWQDPIPARTYELIENADIVQLKNTILVSGHSVSDLVFTAFSAAATFRCSDKRGGANGGRLALSPQNGWVVNQRTQPVVASLQNIAANFNKESQGRQVSLADLIVLGGCVAVEKALADGGFAAEVPFIPGRVDTTQELTDEEMFTWLKPVADGFRNYVGSEFDEVSQGLPPENFFLDKAQLLSLTVPEWVALVGGLRVLGANYDNSKEGIFTQRVGVVSNDFFQAVTSMEYVWQKADSNGKHFSLNRRTDGEQVFIASRCDLIFGANQQLRAVAEVYASSDGAGRFARDFVKVWNKMMLLDRFDVLEKAS